MGIPFVMPLVCAGVGRILLEQVKEPFVRQYRVGRYVFDFYLEKHNLLIEADGTFWHSDPRFYPDRNALSFTQNKNLENDKKKTLLAEQEGYKLLRIWEYDVFNFPGVVINKIRDLVR